MEKKPPVLTVRPVFDPVLAMAEAVPVALVTTAVSVFLLGTFLFLLMSLIGLGRFVSVGSMYAVFSVLGLALTPAVYYELKKWAAARTACNFYDDAFEYQYFRFLVARRRGRVRLRDLGDIVDRPTFLQSRRGLTTLYFVIPGFPALIEGATQGFKIADVPQKSGTRDKIIDLMQGAPVVEAIAAQG